MGAASAAFAGGVVATVLEVGLAEAGEVDAGDVVTVVFEVSGEAVGGAGIGKVVTSEGNVGGFAIAVFSVWPEINEGSKKYPNRPNETMVTRPMRIVNIEIWKDELPTTTRFWNTGSLMGSICIIVFIVYGY
jgi:hypothetical protein